MVKGQNNGIIIGENLSSLPLGEESFLSETQAEKLFPWSKKTFAHKRYKKEGPPYHKIGRNVYYKFSDLLEFFNSGRIEPKNP